MSTRTRTPSSASFPFRACRRVPRQVSYQEYLHLRDQTRTVRQLAAFSYFPAMIGDDDAGGSVGISVSCNFFRVDGLDRAIVGRLLDGGDCAAPGQVPVAVIAEKVWHQRFASDPHIVGRVARVNNRAVTIVGVAPDLTTGWLTPPNVWLPFTAQPYMDSSRNGFTDSALLWLTLAGRVAPGFSRSQVRAEFDILERQEDQFHPGRATAVITTDGSWLSEFELYSSARDLFLLTFFLGSFTLVLLIACANVATLLLSRAASRRREIAVRLSLGAPRIRLVRMLITESLIMAALAGAASVYLVRHVPHPLFRYLAPRAPEYPMNPDWRIFLYISAIVLLSGILSGLAPALESVKVDLASSLKGYGSLLRGGGRLRAAPGQRTGGHEHGAAGGRRAVRQVRTAQPACRPRLPSAEGRGQSATLPGEHHGGGGPRPSRRHRAAHEGAAWRTLRGLLR